MGKSRVDAIQEAVEKHLRPLSPVAVYLFGSVAKGLSRNDSDVDIGIYLQSGFDSYRLFVIAQDMASDLGREVDLVDLSRASAVMRMQVLAHGVLVHEGDVFRRQEFEMYAYSDYARLNEERREVLARYPGAYSHA